MRPESGRSSGAEESPSFGSGRPPERGRGAPLWSRLSLWLLLFSFLIVSLLFYRVQQLRRELDRPMGRSDHPILVRIPEGASAAEIGRIVASRGLAPNGRVFAVAAEREGLAEKLRAGSFLIPANATPRELVRRLAVDPVPRLYIPPGATAAQIIGVLQARKTPGAESAESLVRDRGFLESLNIAAPSLEGYLAPGVYPLGPGDSVREVFVRAVRKSRAKAAELGLDRTEEILVSQGLTPLSAHEVLTLASIIEREAGPDDEAATVSRVFHNRLLRGRKLESCATVRYVIDDWRRPLKGVELKTESPYNTYLHGGLPPGPICSPGETSIRAAIEPAEGKFLYFVARGDGTNHFSLTYEEHKKAVSRYLGSDR